MFPIYCYRCRDSRDSLDRSRCLYCNSDNIAIPTTPANFQPAVSESANVNTGVPALGASIGMTEEELRFLDEIGGDGNYQQVSDQFAAANRNLLPENPNINKDNIFYTNIGRCNPATFDPWLGSATDSHVVPEQRTYIHEQPPRNERQYIDEDGKLDFAGSIDFFPDYSMPNACPDNSFNVNSFGVSQESNNSSVVRDGKGNNLSIRNCCSETVESANAVLEQEVHNSGEADRYVVNDFVKPAPTCVECGKWFTTESTIKIHQQSNCNSYPYKCDQCDESFRFETQLLNHKLKHTAEKRNRCDQCEFATNLKKFLKRHKDRRHEE